MIVSSAVRLCTMYFARRSVAAEDRRSRRESEGASSARRLLVALEHLGLERVPDLAMEIAERLVELDLGDVARARQRDRPVADDAGGRPGRHDDDAARQPDR